MKHATCARLPYVPALDGVRAIAVLGVLGILLMILFRPRKPLIGYSRD